VSLLVAGRLALGLMVGAVDLATTSVDEEIRSAESAIARWDTRRAETIAARMQMRDPGGAEPHLLFARIRFLEGRYADTVAELDRAVELADDSEVLERANEFLEFARPLAELADRFEMVESEHFQINFVEGPDRVIVRRAIEVLEASYSVIGAEFDLFPEQKIRVEIFPDPVSFQHASTLSKTEIETSGTIALCKFNRLMMMSPRLVLRGFSWCDTLCHEYVHYVLWRRNGNTVPIWLHEGIAKYEEVRWSGAPGHELTPLMKRVLKGAIVADEFVTFEEMHPSFAKLPTPQKVALASAEVLSIVQTVMERGGKELLGRMLDALRDGADWRTMFETALEVPFESFWSSWQDEMRVALADVEVDDAPHKLVELRDAMVPPAKLTEGAEASSEVPPDELDEPASGGRWVRLAELLYGRGLYRGAAVEYEKAVAADASPSPVLLNRLGTTYRRAGDLDGALDAYRRSRVVEPAYAPTLTNLGLLHHTRGEAEQAIETLEAAAAINPFDPRIHESLADVYLALGRGDEAAGASDDLRILRESTSTLDSN